MTSCDGNKTAETTTATTEITAPADSVAGHDGMAGMDHSRMAEGTAGTSGMMAAMNTMMKDMDVVKMAGNTDHDFAHMMMAHHKGAVEMSALELKEGKDATLRAMAEKINADQKKEIQELEAFATRLDDAPGNYKPADPKDAFTSAMKASMDGMMKDLGQPTGSADMEYARLMVPHHQRAVDMAKAELAHGRDTKLKEMAQKMIDAQQQEIQQFKAWQAKNGGKMKTSAVLYECPMGCKGSQSAKPGKCPTCEMAPASKRPPAPSSP